MRDNSEHLTGFNSRVKLKQRIAGGAVLLIVLAIFLPFIFNHSHEMAPESNLPAEIVATQTPPVVAVKQAQTSDGVVNGAGTIQFNVPVATDSSTLSTDGVTGNSAVPATETQNQTLDSNQPGLTPYQSESIPEEAVLPAPAPSDQDISDQSFQTTQTVTVPVNTDDRASVTTSDQTLASSEQTIHQPADFADRQQAASALQQSEPAPAVVLPPPTKTTAQSAAQDHWIIQVGSFTQAENAKDLAARLRASGFHAYTKPGPRHVVRVYVGPLTSQKQAEKVQYQLKSEFQINGLIRERRS